MCEVVGGGMVTVYTFYNSFLLAQWLVLVDIDIGLDAGNKSQFAMTVVDIEYLMNAFAELEVLKPLIQKLYNPLMYLLFLLNVGATVDPHRLPRKPRIPGRGKRES